SAPYYVNYVNNRPPDLGAEGIIYIPASASPNGKAIVVLANEVSSTLTFYQVESCVSTLNLSLNTSGNTGFCPGDSLLLQNTGNLNANYQWVKNGINVSGATSPSIQTSSPGSYMLIIDKGVGCKDTTNIVNVSAYPLPNAIITPTGTQEICQGDSLTVSVSSASSYLWSGLQTSQTIVVTNAGNYAVTVIDSNGCSKSSDTVVVNVNALPTVSVTSSGPSVICQGDSVVFTSSSASSYLWSNGATTQNISASLSGNYFVTVTDTNGCSKTSGVQNLNVNTLPVANISAGGPAIFCQGDSVTLLSSAAASYLWSNGATTQQITVSTAGNYSVTITDNNGCSNTSAVQNVIVNSLPLVTANSATVCLGDTIVLSASGATTYIWNTGATTAAITVTGTSPQVIYSVTGTDNNGCSAAVTNTLTTNPLPNVSAVSSAPGDSICSGNTITLNGAGASNYAWSGGIVNGVAFSPSASLTYTVTGTDVNGCSNTYALGVTVNACLGLDVENILFLVNVFPNPANDILNMTFSGSREDLKFELMNGIGQVLITEKSESVNSVNENTIQMNVNELSNGVYFLNVSDNNSNVKTIRVVINK
ncbi:MAG: T9SS type A sorting domain-containing protein, partial [Bacteroidota bacterium]